MKNREFLKQLFEDGGNAGTGADNNAGANNGANNGADNAGGKGSDNAGDNGDGKAEPEKKYTDDDLDKIINKKFADWQKKQKKAVDEAAKLADMNAQERAEHERDELQKELDALRKENTTAQLAKQARTMLTDADVNNVPDELVNMLVADDADNTKANVKKFSKLFKDAVLDAVKNANKKQPPKTGSAGTITREEIMKVANRTERQKLMREHMDLFK